MLKIMQTSSTEPDQPPPRALLVLAFAAVYLIWGSTYLAILVGLETLPPFLLGGLRYSVAGGVLFGLLAARGVARPDARQWGAALVTGLLMLLAGNGLVAWAEQFVTSGFAALVVASAPGWFAVFDWVRPGGRRPPGLVWLGVVLGFSGVALLVLGSGGDDPERKGSLAGAVAVFVATICWAAGSIFSRHAPRPASLWMGAAAQMVCGGAAMLLTALGRGEFSGLSVSALSTRSLLALAYLIVFGSWIAYSAYVWLLKVTTPTRVSTSAFVNPVVAVLLGWGVAGEPITRPMWLALPVILTAVILLTWPRPASRPVAAALPLGRRAH